jgi:hypothetical protein
MRAMLVIGCVSSVALAVALAAGCSVGGDEPWEAADAGGDGDSDGDTDGNEGLYGGEDCYESSDAVVPGSYDGTTEGMGDDYAGSCGGSGPDLVIMFEQPQQGTFTAALVESEIAEAALYVREVCTDDATELACESGTSTPSLAVDLEEGFYFLFVDGVGASDEGSFTIELDVE